MKLPNPPHPLRPRRQKRRPEMQRPLPLPEPAPRHHAHARRVQQPEAVELVRVAAFLFRLRDGARGQRDGRVEVHGALVAKNDVSMKDWQVGWGKWISTNLRFLTNDPLHLLERLEQRRRALVEPLCRAIVLLLVQRIALIALARRIDLHLHQALSHDRRAEHDAHKLVHLRLDLLVEAHELKVSTPVPALAHHALRYAVQGREFDVVEFPRLLFLEVAEAPFERGELADEDVGLVDLVREHDELLLRRELEDAADVVGGQAGARGVAGVDDDDGAHIRAFLLRLLIRGFDGGEVRPPCFALIEVVWHAAGVEHGERGGVEGVLRYRDQDSRLRFRADDVHEGVDARRGTGAQEDAGGICRVSIPSLNVCGNAVANGGHALALAIRTNTVDLAEKPACTVNDILFVAQAFY